MSFYTLDGKPVDLSMTRADMEGLLHDVEDRLVNALRDDPPAVAALQDQGNLVWSLLNLDKFE